MRHIATVLGLSVRLPNGAVVVEGADLKVREGSVLSILGPSGSGKSTLVRALLAAAELRREGFEISWTQHELKASAAFVPQRGALLDHLDVAGNIALAQAGAGLPRDVDSWLAAVDLDPSVGERGRAVGTLSGGQRQRVAVARALAAGRKLVVLDEPSVGLDPLGVRLLARLLVRQARQHGAAIIVITHDLTLAGGASDEIVFLDPMSQRLRNVRPGGGWRGPAELASPEERQRRIDELEEAVEELLLGNRPVHGGLAKRRWLRLGLLAPFAVAGESLLRFGQPKLFVESAVVLRRALAQSFLRPLLFYATVGVLLGLTVPYVIVHLSEELKPAAVLSLIGGSYILSLTPPLSAIVFAATSGSAVNAWLGGLRLHGQVTALEGLGVPAARYLWSPAWVALALAYGVTVLVFLGSMILGGYALFELYEVPDGLAKLTADFLDPPPSRYKYLLRGVWLAVTYTVAIASIVVAKGREPKGKSEDVTAAMTSSVMRATLFVVAMELVTVIVLYALAGRL